MPTFQSKPFAPNKPVHVYGAKIKRHPVLYFGLPFVATIVFSSFVLANLTQTRYDLHAGKVKQIDQEEVMHMKKGRRRVDLREEYWRLQGKDLDNWENKRVERLPDQPEWGVPPESSAQKGV